MELLAGQRSLEDFEDGEFIILVEREAYTPGLGTSLKWDERRIALTRAEIHQLAEKYPLWVPGVLKVGA